MTNRRLSIVFLRLIAVAFPALGLVASLSRPLPAADRKILIVKSKSIAPFNQAAQQFKSCLDAKGVTATFNELVLPDDPVQAESALRAAAADKPDVLLTLGTQASQLAREKLRGVPSVFCMVLDPAGNRLNKGGVSMDPRPEDYVDYIRRSFPQFKRIGILYNPLKLKGLIKEYQEIDIAPYTFVFQEVANIGGIDAALRELKTKADCLFMVMDPGIYTPQTSPQIILQTIQLNLPFIALSSPFVKGGALAGLYADWSDNGCQAADLVERALQGENPAVLPLLPPRKLSSAVNLIVADRLKISIPSSIRAAAQEVVQ